MADAEDFCGAPILQTIGRGVHVQKPEAHLVAPRIGEHGGVSIGAGHIPTVGPVLYVATHHPDGTTLVATLGAAAFRQVAQLFNEAGEEITAGKFNAPEVQQ